MPSRELFKLTQGVIYMLFPLQAFLQFIAKGDSEHIHLSSGGIALNILTAGNALFGNQTQYLSNSGYYLVMQRDCNLVMYQGSSLAASHQVWQTSTAGSGSDCWLLMQTDGNLVIYNTTGSPPSGPWSSKSYITGIPDPNFFVLLQSNGELDIYNFQNDNPKLFNT
ncbi:hypothetical protein BDL97_03G012700, partial [Sphagnum fallax]